MADEIKSFFRQIKNEKSGNKMQNSKFQNRRTSKYEEDHPNTRPKKSKTPVKNSDRYIAPRLMAPKGSRTP